MALIRDGGLIGNLSGAVGSVVASRNRFGNYLRNRTVPVTSTTTYAMNAKAILAQAAQAWRDLTAAQRMAWEEHANETPWFNRIGQSIRLRGQQAFISNFSTLRHLGQATLTVPPLGSPPAPLTSASLVLDVGTGTPGLTFAATPLAAGIALWYDCAVLDSAGITWVQNLLRYIGHSAAAAATGVDPTSLIEARFGALVAGQKVIMMISTVELATGLKSQPLRVEATVIDTP